MKYLHELFARVLAGDSADKILQGLNPMEKGHTGEALIRLLTLLGIHPTDPSSTVVPCKITPESRRLETILTLAERVDLLKTGKLNSGGGNKIDACWRDGKTTCVCSSKAGILKIKSIAELEIGAMLTEFTESGGITENGVRIPRESVVAYQLVPNKYEVIALAEKSKASNKVSKDNLNLLDINDLNRMCGVLLDRVDGCKSTEIEPILEHLLSDTKPALRLRFHQRLITLKINHCIKSGQKTMLIGALPRSGKTWMAAYIAKRFKKVLIITTRPGETKNQWINVFKRHREFSSFNIKDLTASSSSEIATSNRNNEQLVAIASIQFLKMDDRASLIGLDWDIVLLDEIHEGGSTELSETMLDTYIGAKPIRLMMTATYTKPVQYYNIPDECCCFWDLEDTRLMRNWGTPYTFSRLCEKYGQSYVDQAYDDMYKSGETDETILQSYADAPRLGILTNIMHQDIYENLRSITDSPENIYGFSMRSLLMPTKDGKAFQNQTKVDEFLACISGSDYMTRYGKHGNMSIFARIKRYWKTINHRNGDEFMTQMWFLPSGEGQLLKDVKSALAGRIKANSILKDFAVMTIDSGMGDISKAVSSAYIDAKAQGKKGLILLTGNVGSLGVSLPEVDIGFLLHDYESADMNYQQGLRVLTEMLGKKSGLIIDFNVWRILTTLNTYAVSRCGQANKASAERIRWCVSHLVDIDPDLWDCPESPEVFSQSKIVEELTKQWRKMLEQSGVSLQRLALKRVDIGEDQKELDQIARFLEGGNATNSLEVNPDQEKLDSGVERRSQGGSEDEDSQGEKEEEEEEKDDFVKNANINDVLARIIPEAALLSGYMGDLGQALDVVFKVNSPQWEAFNEFFIQLYGIRFQYPASVLLRLVKKNYEKLSDAREIYEIISSRMSSILDSPRELVTYLVQNLKPKEIEKKENGEVFTPPELIEQKFDQVTLADATVWSDPTKKFLDPANGIGNYPALAFHRLMNGLKHAIPNEAERKKHILENMLFMCELNKKNIEVSRKIFDPHNQYKLNLYQGSFLDLDAKKLWNVEKFHVIFGNPPYQEKVGTKKTQSLWDKFVSKSLDMLEDDGFLVMVHPSGWRNIDGHYKDIQRKMMSRHIVYLEIHDEKSGNKTFKSSTRYDWYVLKNTSERALTKIKFQDKEILDIDLTGLEFIPNQNFLQVKELLAGPGQERVNILHSYSLYETRKTWMSKVKKDKFQHPVVYSVNKADKPTFYYSTVNDKGHFGIPKVVFGSGATGFYLDEKGECGLTQFAKGIVDTPEALPSILKIMKKKEFNAILLACSVGKAEVNAKILSAFRKDFWKYIPTQEENTSEETGSINGSEPDYTKMKKADLEKLCKEKNIKGISGKNKAQLIALLTA